MKPRPCDYCDRPFVSLIIIDEDPSKRLARCRAHRDEDHQGDPLPGRDTRDPAITFERMMDEQRAAFRAKRLRMSDGMPYGSAS